MTSRTVICGLPGAGKSFYVNENKMHGDLVWDLDDVAACLLGTAVHERPAPWMPMVFLLSKLFDSLINHLHHNDISRNVWIINSDRDSARAAATFIGALLKSIDTDPATCLARLSRDPMRSARIDDYLKMSAFRNG